MFKQITTKYHDDLPDEYKYKLKQKLACDMVMDNCNSIYPEQWYKIRFRERIYPNEVMDCEVYELTMQFDEIPTEYYKCMTYEDICFQPKKKFFTRVKLAFKYIFGKQQVGYKKEEVKNDPN